MGKADTLTRQYMQDTEVFADAFNYLIYGGEQVIHPQQLHELDTAEIAAFFGENNENAQIQAYRDVLKSVTAMEDGHFAYLILGIENQTGIHYAMPVRNMMYDALQYHSQVRAAANGCRRGKKKAVLSKDEYLSGFRKDDQLLPVITLVVYFGSKVWDGPKSLHEMLTVKDARALAYVADYRINLLEPMTMSDEEIAKLKSDLKDVFSFIKYSRDKDRLQKLVKNSDGFRSMRRSTAEMIKTVTKSDIQLPKGEERVDMCLAIEQMKQESEAMGLAKGEAMGLARGEIKGKLMTLFELVKGGLLTMAQASANAKLTEEQFRAEMAKAGF